MLILSDTYGIIILQREKEVNFVVVGDKIRARREELGMTQDELAERMGYKSRSTITKIEKGVNDVTQSTLIKFAKALNTTPRYLLGWEDLQNQNSAIVPLISIMREDGEFVNLVDVFHQNRDKLQPLVSMMCADEEFLSMVWELANLDDSQRASIRNLLSAFKQK